MEYYMENGNFSNLLQYNNIVLCRAWNIDIINASSSSADNIRWMEKSEKN